MERKHIGLAARQTKINGKICATEEIRNKRAVLRGSTDSCSLGKNIWKIALQNLGADSPFGKHGVLVTAEMIWYGICTDALNYVVWKTRAIVCNFWNEPIAMHYVEKRLTSIQESLTKLSLSRWCWTLLISSEFSNHLEHRSLQGESKSETVYIWE